MAITWVADLTFHVLVGSGTETKTLPGGLQENDFLIAVLCSDQSVGNGTGGLAGINSSGYTDIYHPSTNAPGNQVAWKRMGATPDTTLVVAQHTGEGHCGFVQIWRGVDTTNAFIKVKDTVDPEVFVQSATGGTLMPDPPSYTPHEAPGRMFAVGLLDDDNDQPNVTAPSGYGQLIVRDASTTPAGNCTAMMASKEITDTTAQNPDRFGGLGTDQWDAIQFVLRPAPAAAAASLLRAQRSQGIMSMMMR